MKTTKAIVLTFFICIISTLLSAQNNNSPLDGPALEKAIYLNKKSDLPEYHGIYHQYSITVDGAEALSKFEARIKTEIKKIPDLSDCIIDPSNAIVIVRISAENAKQNHENNMAEIKKILSDHDLKLLNYTEATFKN